MKSIKISKLGCKIMSGLTACIIGLSPCIGTQVSAIWIPSAGQNIDIGNCTKKQLLEVVPDVWERFWIAYDAARYAVGDAAFNAAGYAARYAAEDAAGDAAYDAARYAAYDAAYDAARNTAWYDAYYAARNTAWYAAYDAAFVNAWRRGEAAYKGETAYKIVKHKDRAYFENLVRVLEEQIAIFEDIANTNQH